MLLEICTWEPSAASRLAVCTRPTFRLCPFMESIVLHSVSKGSLRLRVKSRLGLCDLIFCPVLGWALFYLSERRPVHAGGGIYPACCYRKSPAFLPGLQITDLFRYLNFCIFHILLLNRNCPTSELIGQFLGSPCWTRTNDPAVNSRMLYRLS